MATTLLLGPSDIPKLTKISGNIDVDIIVPYIYQAQITDIKRILTLPLYDKIISEYESGTMSGEYKIIYEGFIVDMLVYYSAANFMKFGAYQISNAGIYKHQPENGVAIELKEVDNLVNRYRSLGESIELMFIDYMRTSNISEYDKSIAPTEIKGFGWYF